jgi:hypothetical protein
MWIAFGQKPFRVETLPPPFRITISNDYLNKARLHSLREEWIAVHSRKQEANQKV